MSHLRAVGIEISATFPTAAWVAPSGRSSLFPFTPFEQTTENRGPAGVPTAVGAAVAWREVAARARTLVAAGGTVVLAAGSRSMQQESATIQQLAGLDGVTVLPRCRAAALALADSWGLLATRPTPEGESEAASLRAVIVDLDASGGELVVYELSPGLVQEVSAQSWSHAEAAHGELLPIALNQVTRGGAVATGIVLGPELQRAAATAILNETLGRSESRLHPAEAVARGCALYADAMSTANEEQPRANHFALLPVAAGGIAVELAGTSDGAPRPWGIIAPGSALPASVAFELETPAEQPAKLRLLQADLTTGTPVFQTLGMVTLPASAGNRWEMQLELTAAGEVRLAGRTEPDAELADLPLAIPTDWSSDRLAAWQSRLTPASTPDDLAHYARLEVLAGWLPGTTQKPPVSTVTIAAESIEPWQITPAAEAEPATPWSALESWSSTAPADGESSESGSTTDILAEDREAGVDGGEGGDAMSAFASDTPARVTRIAPAEAGGPLFQAINIGCLLFFSVAGLFGAYYILSLINPSYNYFRLPLPGVSAAAPEK